MSDLKLMLISNCIFVKLLIFSARNGKIIVSFKVLIF